LLKVGDFDPSPPGRAPDSHVKMRGIYLLLVGALVAVDAEDPGHREAAIVDFKGDISHRPFVRQGEIPSALEAATVHKIVAAENKKETTHVKHETHVERKQASVEERKHLSSCPETTSLATTSTRIKREREALTHWPSLFSQDSRELTIASQLADEEALYRDLDEIIDKTGLSEGHSNQIQTEMAAMNNLASDSRVEIICETGFNGGHGTLRWLLHSNATVYSFDIGTHNYSIPAAKFLFEKFPGRHIVNWGDSTETIPKFKEEHPDVKCNLIFVDGGHSFAVAEADLKNFGGMFNSSYNVLMIDDVMCRSNFCKGPNDAWDQLIQSGAAVQTSASSAEGGERGFAYGKYTVQPQ